MNLPDLLSELKIRVKAAGQDPHVRPGWIGLECPWCGRGSGKWHLGINLDGGYATCWRCGHHRLGDVLAEATGRSVGECLGLLKGVGWERVRREEKPRGRLKMPAGVDGFRHAHRLYLEGRGFDPDAISRLWGVRGIGPDPRLPWRLWIPVHLRGEVVSWTTRSIGRGASRYLSAKPDEEALPLKSLLYGEDHVRHAVVVCEGPVDAWAIGPGAVATFGLICTREQVARIASHPVRAICFDSEPAAQRRAGMLADSLAGLPGETSVVKLETGKDAAEADRDEVAELKKKYLD